MVKRAHNAADIMAAFFDNPKNLDKLCEHMGLEPPFADFVAGDTHAEFWLSARAQDMWRILSHFVVVSCFAKDARGEVYSATHAGHQFLESLLDVSPNLVQHFEKPTIAVASPTDVILVWMVCEMLRYDGLSFVMDRLSNGSFDAIPFAHNASGRRQLLDGVWQSITFDMRQLEPKWAAGFCW